MAIFRSQSSAAKQEKKKAQQAGEYHSQTPQDPHLESHYKVDTAAVHDPILLAVNEAQPFEDAAAQYNKRPSYLSQESGDLKDIFGQPIQQADMLNPARARNERPMDTIRGFEYAITGDSAYREQLESNRLGWGFHEDFAHNSLNSDTPASGYQQPVASFGGSDQPIYQAANYSASLLNPEGKKKKKGLFGRKKK